jgi:hypothetical protein
VHGKTGPAAITTTRCKPLQLRFMRQMQPHEIPLCIDNWRYFAG